MHFLLITFVVASLCALSWSHPALLPPGVAPPVNCSRPTPILSFHVHVVYTIFADDQIAAATALREIARKEFAPFTNYPSDECITPTPGNDDPSFNDGRLCFIVDHTLNETDAGSPFVSGEWSIFIPVDYYGLVVPWFTQHYQDTHPDFSMLVHTNTGCEYEDHSIWSLWAGKSWPLNLNIFKKDVQTNEFNHTRGDSDNPTCLAAGGVCGLARTGASIPCCEGLACGKCDSPKGCTCA